LYKNIEIPAVNAKLTPIAYIYNHNSSHVEYRYPMIKDDWLAALSLTNLKHRKTGQLSNIPV
jgi:hypothetical protein